MQGLLALELGRHVTVEQANSEQLSGKLIQINSDYLTILDRNELPVHIQFGHIVSVVVNHAELVLPMDGIVTKSLPTFVDLLRSMSGQIVRVGVGNRVKDGVVYKVNNEEISMILDMKHTIYYPIYQIQRLSLVLNSVKPGTSYDKNEESVESNVTEELNTHKSKSEESTADTQAVQKVADTGGSTSTTNPFRVIAEADAEAKEQTHRDEQENPTVSSEFTVLKVKQTDAIHEGLFESDIRWYEPMTAMYEQGKTAKRPQKRIRNLDHKSASKLTMFHSKNKSYGLSENAARYKLS
jgi:hypothetical protein